MRIRIALVQFKTKPHDAEENFRRAEALIRRASKKADLVVFPEQFLTGPIEGYDLAVLETELLPRLREIAKRYGVDLVPGSAYVKDGAETFNRAYYIDSTGKVLGSHDKINLWQSEKSLSSGKQVNAFKTRFGMAALVLCWDMLDHSVINRIRAQGTDLVICPNLWWQGSESRGKIYDGGFAAKFFDSICLSRAYESRSILACCNAAGKIKFSSFTDSSVGHSQVTAPFIGQIGALKNSREGTLLVEVDTAVLGHARAYFGK